MATLPLLCRLKVLSFLSSVASSNELSRSLLIKPNNENERSFPYNQSFGDVLDETKGNTCRRHRYRSIKEGWSSCVAKDVSRYELSRIILLNEGKNTLSLKIYEHSAERKNNIQKTFLFDKRSPIVSQYPLAKIYHSWMFSKEPRPSARYFCSSTRMLSNSALKFHSSIDNPFYKREKLGKRKNSSQMIIPCYENVRGYSSCKKESKSEECPEQEKQELFEDICSETKSDSCDVKTSLNECPDSSRPCKPLPEDPSPVCTTPPCPNIEDYCREKDPHKEKFWRTLACFVAMPILIIISIYTYTEELEKKKEPRPEFEDVPWMHKITKPFPWGDGKHSLFHNPVKNPISPHGYEVEDPNAARKTEQKKEKEN